MLLKLYKKKHCKLKLIYYILFLLRIIHLRKIVEIETSREINKFYRKNYLFSFQINSKIKLF
jgi:hypothetical protein